MPIDEGCRCGANEWVTLSTGDRVCRLCHCDAHGTMYWGYRIVKGGQKRTDAETEGSGDRAEFVLWAVIAAIIVATLWVVFA